jgi:EAL domain-containing protein (putative c-di-GMP-specific phosphodiesterase class I)/CheY-like chemotaxis protein
MARRILVVDDDALILRGVSRLLTRRGMAVSVAADVQEARQHIATTEFDAAIVDYQLARASGLEVLALLLEKQPLCIRILFTGRSDPTVLVDAINQGEVAKVLRKPFEPDQLIAELDEAFEAAQRNRRLRDVDPLADAEQLALSEVLRPERLGMALQPLFDLVSGAPALFAYECLIRPKHPRLWNPGLLIDAAVKHHRILDMGAIVLQHAASILARLPPEPQLFVNLHPEQLADPDRLRRDLQPLAAQAGRVILEITEQASATSLTKWEESMDVIASAGFRTAVDDLGSGYSSLSILADLKPQFIKLDMSLVRNVHKDPRKQRLVALMQSFGAATDSRVVGEGVETAEEARALTDAGVEILQGFHFARPSELIIPLPVYALAG